MLSFAFRRTCLAGAALALALAAQPASAQSAFECPAEPLDGARSDEIARALPGADSFSDADALVGAVTSLNAEGVPAPVVVDNLVAAYCPVVAGDGSLSDAQKTQKVRVFAARVTRVVYGLDSADAIILDVPFAPTTLDSITEKARQAGVSPQDWVRDVVEIALD